MKKVFDTLNEWNERMIEKEERLQKEMELKEWKEFANNQDGMS